MKLFLIIFVSAVTFFKLIYSDFDYCAWDYTYLCRSYPIQLTLCGAKEKFADNCPPDVRMEYMNRTLILDYLNDKRQLVSRGKLQGVQSASKMNRLLWCQELETIAEHSVRLCYENDAFCPRTIRFKDGDLYSREYEYVDSETQVDIALLNKWWQSYKNRNFNSTRPKENKKDKEGFAYFANDGTTHIGCAATRYTRNADHKFLLACAFSHEPNYQSPYTPGIAATLCLSGIKSTAYPGLCEISAEAIKKVSDVC